MERLLRVASARNRAHEYDCFRVRTLRVTHEALRKRCREDGISINALFEALARGFINKHPSALALVDQWAREEGLELKPMVGPTLNRSEVAEVYAAIGDCDSYDSQFELRSDYVEDD